MTQVPGPLSRPLSSLLPRSFLTLLRMVRIEITPEAKYGESRLDVLESAEFRLDA